jgi:hypothetical protein
MTRVGMSTRTRTGRIHWTGLDGSTRPGRCYREDWPLVLIDRPRRSSTPSGERTARAAPVHSIEPPRVPTTLSEDLLTKGEIAARLRVTMRTIDNYARRGMPYEQLPGGRLFDWSLVLAWLRRQGSP